MERIYQGKTKDVFKTEEPHVILLQFKDDVTGKDGVFDPGENQVIMQMEGVGHANLRITRFFFEKLNAAGIPTHYIDSDLDKNTMRVKECQVFGKGLEVICRFFATGSFIRRYGLYAEEMQPLKDYVEITLKDDDRQDPLITKDALVMLNIITADQYEDIVRYTKDISGIVRDLLQEKGMTLIDIKLEFGMDHEGNVLLIDEISAGNMRIYKDGEKLDPFTAESLILA